MSERRKGFAEASVGVGALGLFPAVMLVVGWVFDGAAVFRDGVWIRGAALCVVLAAASLVLHWLSRRSGE